MITSLEDQLRRDEGVRLRLYVDTVGKRSIGVGRNLDDVGIYPDEMALMLSNDVKSLRAGLETAFPWVLQLDEARRGVMENLAFNMGVHGLSQFKIFLAHMEAGEWMGAQAAMMDSLWAKQVGARAERLAEQVQTGVWV